MALPSSGSKISSNFSCSVWQWKWRHYFCLTRRQCQNLKIPPILQLKHPLLDCVWNVMAHAQKPDFVFRRNGRVHLNQRGRQFSRLLAAEVCASALVMLDTPCSEVVWRVLATHSIRQFPLHFPSLRHRVPSHFNWTLLQKSIAISTYAKTLQNIENNHYLFIKISFNIIPIHPVSSPKLFPTMVQFNQNFFKSFFFPCKSYTLCTHNFYFILNYRDFIFPQ
jgi:hypothetical protein